MRRGKFAGVLLAFQVVFLVLFGLFVEYDNEAHALYIGNNLDPGKGGDDPAKNSIKDYYPMFQDVHVMMFIGFGFLMTFLKRYGFSSVGFNMLIAAFVLEWHILFSGFLHLHDGKIHVNIVSLLSADFAAAAVLITFGALLGKTSPLQMIIVAFIEIVVFSANEYIGLNFFNAADIGGSMFVHVFGAYFGLGISRVLFREDIHESDKEGSRYHSDLFSMIGTIFLWLYWPSFNSALGPGDDQHRAVINTYLALAACTVVAFSFSALLSKESKFDMVHVQNATLAGGVAVGTSANMMIHPWGAILIGCLAGALSVVGFKYITPFMSSKLKLHDTCGVNNLHGMPGLLAGICGAVAAGCADVEAYGYSLFQIFPARAPTANFTRGENDTAITLAEINEVLTVEAGQGWTAAKQAGFQIVALLVTFVVAFVFGIVTGLILRLPVLDRPKGKTLFDDGPWWETPEDFDEEAASPAKPDKLLQDTTVQEHDESKI